VSPRNGPPRRAVVAVERQRPLRKLVRAAERPRSNARQQLHVRQAQRGSVKPSGHCHRRYLRKPTVAAGDIKHLIVHGASRHGGPESMCMASIFLVPEGSRRVLGHAARNHARHEDPACKRTRWGPPAGARRQLPDGYVEHADRPVRHGVVGRAVVDAHQQLRERKAPITARRRRGAGERSLHATGGPCVSVSCPSEAEISFDCSAGMLDL
jgi:hypothetical protein